MPKNVHTSKKYGDVKSSLAGEVRPTKNVSYANRSGMYEGQMHTGKDLGAASEPMNRGVVAPIKGMSGTYDDIGEKSGFVVDGYLDKGGVPFGEAAKFNYLPPGMEIDNQENAEIHTMPLYKVTHESYPGDGWMPEPRDIPE